MADSKSKRLGYLQQLYTFAVLGDWDELLNNLESTLDAQVLTDDEKSSLLVSLASFGNGDIVHLLVKRGADVSFREPTGTTALEAAVYGAAKHDTSDAIRVLIEFGADPNMLASGGESLLRLSILQNKIELTQLLVSLGADPFLKPIGDYDETAMQYAKTCSKLNSAAAWLLISFPDLASSLTSKGTAGPNLLP